MNTTKVCAISHPKSSLLSVDIQQLNKDGRTFLFFEKDGDWYEIDENNVNEDMLIYPTYFKALSACMYDAVMYLNRRYKGWGNVDYGAYSESRTFRAMQG